MLSQSPTVGIQVMYQCGECGEDVALSAQDAIRCKRCGHRILYKKRTSKKVSYEAR